MKSKTITIHIVKEYIGKKLLSRWKTTTTERKINGATVIHTKQDKNNFYSVTFSGNHTDDWKDANFIEFQEKK